ncbi:hypothetical protein IC762_09705 [Bradyrhizobium genosp. L]|uniref:hypothetical protein n=1 Tax=Bradyrhizobium genosp. L TaxID=83637 RepID=UPI0018A30282|nr:hypothetical protein [Bradyrhizobium genosp. L]QPF88439.1 hypothetical protein IC762_09705 [Bradyrhizobium genosp. L]
MEKSQQNQTPDEAAVEDRRKFLAACGKFAVVTPPAITMLLSTSLTSDAIARSGGSEPGPKPPPDGIVGWLESLLDRLF